MRVQKIRLLVPAYKFHLFQRHVASQIKALHTMTPEKILYIQQPQLMVFPFRKKEKYRPLHLPHRYSSLDAYDQLLTDDIGHQMLLRRLNMTGDPENADPVKKGEDDLCDAPVDAMHQD